MTRPKLPSTPPAAAAAIPSDYAPLLAEIKSRVQSARIKAGLAANRELLTLYWDIGRLIAESQRTQGYGKKVVERLATDIQLAFPGMSGFSSLNVWRMRAFYLAYPDDPAILSQAVTDSVQTDHAGSIGDSIVQQPAAQLPTTEVPASRRQRQKLSQPVTQSQATPPSETNAAPRTADTIGPPEPIASLPWGHNLLLLHKLDDRDTRLWYAAQAVEHGWSRNILVLQIDSGLHHRQGKAVTNFTATLPPAQSDLAQQLTKDPYLFDFLTLTDDANERSVELGLINHVEKFLLELGAGFALVGRQVHLDIGDQDFYLDLLFYHLKLRCFIVIDLKARDFTPEAAGKMNFYLSAVDDTFRHAGDQPSIGLILCRNKNRVLAEYALRDMAKPIGVSGYVTQLVASLPQSLKGSIPSIEELEKALTPDIA